MARLGLVLLAGALGACDLLQLGTADGPAAPVDGPDAGPAEAAAVAAHNQVRAQAVPTPSPVLPAMEWDDAAAAVARDWAGRCHYGHSGTSGFGENIFASTATGDTIGLAVASWASEAADYSYADNTCAAGRICGHYTQLVWRASTGVGCASQVCDTGSPFGSGRWVIWVCDYRPPGNYVGERPY